MSDKDPSPVNLEDPERNGTIPMRSRRSSLLIASAFGLLVGIGYPFVDLALSCRAPTSEACVWGKAYLPLTLGVSVVLLGGAVTVLVYAWLMRKPRPRSDDDAV